MSAATPEVTIDLKQPVMLSTDRPPETSTEFRIGIRSAPYLVDHGFQDMVVLPGSFYIEMALAVERKLTQRVPGLVRNVTFRNPIILSTDGEDAVIRVDMRNLDNGHVEFTFHETSVGNGGTGTSVPQYAAKLEIDRNPSTSPRTGADTFSIEAFQAQSHSVIDSDRFYKTLRENGNQYGPSFQKVSAIWRASDGSLGRISVERQDRETGPHGRHPGLLDSVAQLLAPFIKEKGRTFILRSIEKVEITDANLPDTLWGHAVLRQEGESDGKGLVGNVRVFDQSGGLLLELCGVAFTFLDRVDVAEEKTATKLVITSNFTAEPVGDSLRFWGDHFGVPIDVEFGPYGQVFQQLLDTGSAFCRNSNGVNIVLLGLEEWAKGDRNTSMQLSKERAQQCFGASARYALPNGLEIVHLNQYETDYVYKEIFEDQCYLKHGVVLRDGATVVDIGANIGLFSLFVMSHCANPRIYAFEPAPIVYDLLRANCNAYGSNVRTVNAGVSDKTKSATLTFYEKSSVFSGFHSDETEDRAAIQTVVRNVLNRESVVGESLEEYVNELTSDRLRRTTHECRMTSVSDIIRENRIDRIDLLKIDAEKSELEIIEGIQDSDWPKIDQIVIEIHDRTREAVNRIENLLIEKGYRCAVEHEKLLERSGLFNLYATRGEAGRAVHSRSESVEAADSGSDRACRSTGTLQKSIQDFCAALATFMHQATAPLVLCVCPKTPAAEADAELKAAMNDAEEALLTGARRIPNVHTIGSASALGRYPMDDYHDPESHRLGHIPYTPACYAAIGTALVRTIFKLKRNPYKVIVLDCDNTLWKGVCGEDGPMGIELSGPYRGLQEFMVSQMNAGMLLCLCSKNNEKDVLDVFNQRTDMVLKREHLVSHRINWNAKSENIKSLAKELNLGLDSFIFLDDNPVDCADVRINCPAVLTLQLPRNAESLPSFLNHIWAFDHDAVTEEDQSRTRMYQESTKRQQFREQSFSLKDFVKGLQLRVDMSEATEGQLDRVSQLTFRTNQFNFTSIRRSANEIKEFLRSEGSHCLAVCVADRFGDYGLVGVAMYETEADRYKVDSLLLSCRVLGRGVEHALLSLLGRRAVKEGKTFVEFKCVVTEKNLPALEFITSIGAQYRNEAGTCWAFPAERLASMEYDPDQDTQVESEAPATVKPEKPTRRPPSLSSVVDASASLQRIGENLHDIERLEMAIEEYRIGTQLLRAVADVTPGSALESAVANIWKKVLGKPHIGMNDNFFESGGTSLKAVQVIAMIKKELQQNLSIISMFEYPTVALLAAKLDGKSGEARVGVTTEGAALRGQRRRYKTTRQHTA